jgi:hypothetical protein
MRRQKHSPTTLLTILPTPIDILSRRTLTPAHHNPVLLSLRRPVLVQPAAFTRTEEQIPVPFVLKHKRSFYGVLARRLKRNLLVPTHLLERGTLHRCDEEVLPERSKGHVVLVSDLDEIAVDGVVGLAFAGTDTSGSVVRPAFQVRRSRIADFAVLGAEAAYAVEEIVCVADFADVRGLLVVLALSLFVFLIVVESSFIPKDPGFLSC